MNPRLIRTLQPNDEYPPVSGIGPPGEALVGCDQESLLCLACPPNVRIRHSLPLGLPDVEHVMSHRP